MLSTGSIHPWVAVQIAEEHVGEMMFVRSFWAPPLVNSSC